MKRKEFSCRMLNLALNLFFCIRTVKPNFFYSNIWVCIPFYPQVFKRTPLYWRVQTSAPQPIASGAQVYWILSLPTTLLWNMSEFQKDYLKRISIYVVVFCFSAVRLIPRILLPRLLSFQISVELISKDAEMDCANYPTLSLNTKNI